MAGGQKAAIIAQVGQIYSDGVGQYYIGDDTYASAVEGLVRLIIPRGTRRTDVDAAGVEKLRAHIDE